MCEVEVAYPGKRKGHHKHIIKHWKAFLKKVKKHSRNSW